jgi:hypothetical protein
LVLALHTSIGVPSWMHRLMHSEPTPTASETSFLRRTPPLAANSAPCQTTRQPDAYCRSRVTRLVANHGTASLLAPPACRRPVLTGRRTPGRHPQVLGWGVHPRLYRVRGRSLRSHRASVLRGLALHEGTAPESATAARAASDGLPDLRKRQGPRNSGGLDAFQQLALPRHPTRSNLLVMNESIGVASRTSPPSLPSPTPRV